MLRTGVPWGDRKGSVARREAVRAAPDFAGWTTESMTARRSEMLPRIRTWRLGFRRVAIGSNPAPMTRTCTRDGRGSRTRCWRSGRGGATRDAPQVAAFLALGPSRAWGLSARLC